jgi:AcrR family transcriptional regulator
MKFGCGNDGSGPKKNAAQRLSETAKELFYQRGIRAVGVDEIVTHAGVTKPSLYRSFSSKDELVAAYLREILEESRAGWAEVLDRAPGDPRAQLSLILRAFADKAACDDFRGCAFGNAAVEFPEADHIVHQLSCQAKTELRENFLTIIRQLPVKQPELLADGLMLLVEGTQAARHVFCNQGPAASLVPAGEALIDAFMDEPGKPAPERRRRSKAAAG